jgi:hypothetical protein
MGPAASDLRLRLLGGDLVVGIVDPSNPTAPFKSLTDNITLKNWTNRIETFRFADGTTLPRLSVIFAIWV